MAREIRLPTFAIGGIDAGNLSDVLATGIERVAVSGAVTKSHRAAEAALAVRTLLGMLESAAATAASPADSRL
jgi:thiamine monophosphate synthase